MGSARVPFTLSGLTAEEYRALLDKYGLKASAERVNVGARATSGIEAILAENRILAIEYWGPAPPRYSRWSTPPRTRGSSTPSTARVAVAVPELAPQHQPTQRPPQDAWSHHPSREVEPDEGVGPDDVGDPVAVVAVDDPPAVRPVVAVQHPAYLGPELLDRRLLPSGPVVQGVELEQRQAEPCRQPPGQVRLAGAAVPDDAEPASHARILPRLTPVAPGRCGADWG